MESNRARAVLYTRVSVTRDISLSLAGQSDDLAARAALEGWDVVAAFADDGISGAKQRENVAEALQLITDGRADILAVYAYDRWSRQGLEDAAPLIRTLRIRRESGKPARFVALREGIDDDGSDENFEMRLSFAADLAKKERERIRSRVVQSRRRLAHAGRFGGGTPPFGYRPAPGPVGRTLVVDEHEAAIVREVATRIISNESLVRIAADLTARRIPRSRSPYRIAALRLADGQAGDTVTVRTGPGAATRTRLNRSGQPVDVDTREPLATGTWDQSRVRDLWCSPHLLGRLVVNGAVMMDGEAPAQPFPAILDLATHQQILARFAGVSRGHQRRRKRVHLLSGLVYCDGCHGRMYPRDSGGVVYFGCSASGRGEACPLGHPRIKEDFLEGFVVDRFLSRVTGIAEVKRIESVNTEARVRLADVRSLITETSAMLADRSADRAAILTRLDALQAEEARLEALPSETAIEFEHTGRTVGEAWEASEDLDSRRALLESWVDHIVISKAQARGRRVDTGRISIEWNPAVDVVERDEGNSRGRR